MIQKPQPRSLDQEDRSSEEPSDPDSWSSPSVLHSAQRVVTFHQPLLLPIPLLLLACSTFALARALPNPTPTQLQSPTSPAREKRPTKRDLLPWDLVQQGGTSRRGRARAYMPVVTLRYLSLPPGSTWLRCSQSEGA